MEEREEMTNRENELDEEIIFVQGELSQNNSQDFKLKLKQILTNCREKTSKISPIIWIFTLFILFAILGSNIALIVSYEGDKGLEQPPELEMTAEFQMTLNSDAWKIRNDMLFTFFNYFEQISGFPFSEHDIVQNYRIQTYFHPDNCSAGKWDMEFRLRNYVWGPAANTTTLDAKIGDISYTEGLIAPLEPSDDLLKDSFQKLEHDVHPCDKKYSRESRVQGIPFQPIIKTCGDLHRYYPYIWSDDTAHKTATETTPGYWYTGVYEGNFSNGVKFKSDITLKYDTLEMVYNDNTVSNPPPTGEFSLRIWSTHVGHGPWNETSFNEISEWHQLLLKQFGSPGDYPC